MIMRQILAFYILCITGLIALADPVPPLTEYVEQKLLVRFLSDKSTSTLEDSMLSGKQKNLPLNTS
jgi:hypothetical protein